MRGSRCTNAAHIKGPHFHRTSVLKSPVLQYLNSSSMNKLVSIILLVGGIVLIVYGINASNSIGSDFSRLFTGSPTDKSVWLLIGGVVAAAVGAGGLFRGSR